jgi:hypothetical protein
LVAGGGLNSSAFNAPGFNEGGLGPHNLQFVIRRAIEFIRQQDDGEL